MPCKPRMSGCASTCLHRQLVENYRDTRHAWEALRESDTTVPAAYAYGADTTAAQLEDDDFRAAFPAPTFREWLTEHAGQREDPDQ